jgi:hypothetical protein
MPTVHDSVDRLHLRYRKQALFSDLRTEPVHKPLGECHWRLNGHPLNTESDSRDKSSDENHCPLVDLDTFEGPLDINLLQSIGANRRQNNFCLGK